MISGRVASLHISQKEVHVVEADVNRGLIEVTNAFAIRNFDRFFSRGKLINMSTMVEAITMAMTTNGITATRLMVTFDGAFQTSFSIEPISSVKKRRSLRDIFPAGGDQQKDNNDGADLDSSNGATIKHKHSWGQYITQDDQGEAVSVTLAERDMVDSFVSAFGASGFKVISIEAPDTSLIYARNIVEFSYDYVNKIIIQSEDGESGNLYVLTKDVPSTIKRIQFDTLEGFDMEERIVELCTREATNQQMRNPLVFLVGSAFKSTDDYISIADHLETEDMHVMDLYALADNSQFVQNAVQITLHSASENDTPELSCEYGICMCQLLRCYEAKPENLYEGRLPSLFSTKNKLQVCHWTKVAAIVFMVANVLLTAAIGFETLSVNSVIKGSSNLSSQLTKVEAERANAQLQLQVLDTLDPRLNDVFTFILENVDSSLNIASVDTVDMIPTTQGSTSQLEENTNRRTSILGIPTGSTESETTEETNQTTPAAAEQVKKQLVIRGYSTKSSGPIDLYNALNKAAIDEIKLVGHQQMTLPSGETIYAFEIRVGENYQ